MKKRSLTIRGHATSISLEEEFWQSLKQLAAQHGLALAALVTEIDSTRGAQNLSSALRVYVLKTIKRHD